MADEMNSTPPALAPDPAPAGRGEPPPVGVPDPEITRRMERRLALRRGAAMGLGALVVVLIAWAISPWSPLRPPPVCCPTPVPPTVGPFIPPTATPAPATPVVQNTPTLVMGAATFTPEPGRAVNGPHVLGITAGVGQRLGDIAGIAPIAVTFSEAMDQASAQAAFALSPAAPGAFNWQQNTLLFTPNTPLAPSTAYTVRVDSAAKTQGGKTLAAPLAANFTTAPPPAILRTLPSAGASEVPTNTIITISFNRPMIPLTALDNQPDASQWVTISPAVAGRWVWLGTAAAGFRATTGFQPAQDYTVTVKAGWPDANGVGMAQGTTFPFATIKPAILSVQPYNGSQGEPLDTVVLVRFNMAMDHASVERAFTLHVVDRNATLQGTTAWSPDSTVLTFTPASLLEFSQDYGALIGGQVQPANGHPTELSGTANNWEFRTTDSTRLSSHYPDSDSGPAQPATSFGFGFNNPLVAGQDVAQFLTVSPAPEGYHNQLTLEGAGVYTQEVKLLPNTTYTFTLKPGLKDKWGFSVPGATWTVKIGPLPPSVTLKGGTFQPVYSGGPTRVRLETENLSKVTLHLYQLSETDVRDILQGTKPTYDNNGQPVYPGTLKRQWDVTVQPDATGAATTYPVVALDGQADRLPAGYYLVQATAPSPYDNQPLQTAVTLAVGRVGFVTKSEGRDLLVWAADLGSGKPVAGYNLRVEQWHSSPTQPTVTRGRTGADGVWRGTLGATEDSGLTVVWSEETGDAGFVTTGWSANIEPSSFGVPVEYGASDKRAAIYADRPIYRPAQTVYFRGVVRLDDDARYTLPPNGTSVALSAYTYGNDGQKTVYTGTATLGGAGTFSGQFLLPADAPTGSYTLSAAQPGAKADEPGPELASVSFDVQEYRKPDFQVNVTAPPSQIHGDPVTATVQTSYYFGGPLANVTTTINLQSSPYTFYWSDPTTGEGYTFGEGGGPIIYDYFEYGFRPGPYATPAPVQSFQARTDANGLLTVDVSKYVTTTESSQSVLIEGQVQDLSNQTVAANSSTVVHQGLYYVGLRTDEYIATAKKPMTVTVRTVDVDGKLVPNTAVALKFVREDWAAPTDNSGNWKLTETPVGDAQVTTDAQGRAVYLYTPPTGGTFRVRASSTDRRGNNIHSSLGFWASSTEPGVVGWRFTNDQAVTLVADTEKYQIGDTAHILVTSPYSQATGLLTIERGHLKRYRVLTIQGGAPTIDVKIEDGDLPNVVASLTLLGTEPPPAGAPADWGNHVVMRAGFVNLSVDTSGKELHVSLEPQGEQPYAPGSTVSMTVHTTDKNGKPASGELSLAVVDEAIFALAGDTSPDLFDTFWSERGTNVHTATSFSSGETNSEQFAYDARLGFPASGGAIPNPGPPPATAAAAEDGSRNKAAPTAPKTVRSDFRDTAFWVPNVTTGADGSAVVPVKLPDNLTTWRLTARGINGDTLAGMVTGAITATQPLLLRPVQPRFLTTGDQPHPQAIIHNNTGKDLQVVASLEVSGALTLTGQPTIGLGATVQNNGHDVCNPCTFDLQSGRGGGEVCNPCGPYVLSANASDVQPLTVPAGQQVVVTWSATVGKGDVANLRYWVHTLDANAPDYREDAVAAHLPVKPFAAPEAVATSGQVDGTRADETIFLPYTVNPLLGELVVQVSPSLAAATTDSLSYVTEYPYESTDSTVSRFLPLVVLEQVYNEQGLKTPYAPAIPGIVQTSVARLAALQQPDGGWAWWERGPSDWWDTAYVVQGLVALRDAGYAVPGDMLQNGIARLRAFQGENDTSTFDETYHLNMRAYTLYVLGLAVGGNNADQEMLQAGRDLAGQTARLSTHGKAWAALGLAKVGLNAESKTVLDSLAASARQTSTTAHWEEGTPDYWSMGTDNRATALALDALVTLAPNDPLIPKTVRWLMTAEKEGHWLTTQETAFSLISLAHYMRQSKELEADYTWQVSAFDKLLGGSVANRETLTRTATLTLPVSDIPPNTLGDLVLARDKTNGQMYYQISLHYYVPGEGIKARSEGLGIARSYYRLAGGAAGAESADPVKEAQAGDLLKVRLTIAVPETSYYVLVTDPLPAGLEGVNGSLNTTSFTERPPNPFGILQPQGGPTDSGYFDPYYYWGPFDNVEMRDDRTVLFARYMAPGTYVYEYYARATTPGVYLALPAHAELLYYPDVFGHSDGGAFTVK